MLSTPVLKHAVATGRRSRADSVSDGGDAEQSSGMADEYDDDEEEEDAEQSGEELEAAAAEAAKAVEQWLEGGHHCHVGCAACTAHCMLIVCYTASSTTPQAT